jgi:hypothetical protein
VSVDPEVNHMQAQVLPATNGWKIKVGDIEVEFDTQQQAIDEARTRLLSGGGGELVVHGEDGKIRQKDTIGKEDPRDIPG